MWGVNRMDIGATEIASRTSGINARLLSICCSLGGGFVLRTMMGGKTLERNASNFVDPCTVFEVFELCHS